MSRRPDSLTAFSADTGEAWGRIQHPDARPSSGVLFSRDGQQLIVTTATGVIQMWQLDALRTGLRECGLDFPLPL
jgi:sugar lactone lactonase YvrE